MHSAAALNFTMERSHPPLTELRAGAAQGDRVFTFIDLSNRHRGHIFPWATIDLVATWATSWAAAGWRPFIVSEESRHRT